MDDAAASVERRPTSSHHRERRASIAFRMLATTAVAGNTDERHRIADEDGRQRRWGESHRRGRRRLRDQECRDDYDATSIRALRKGEQHEREEEREVERRAMWRRRQQGCDDGIDEPRERGDDAEHQNGQDEGDVTMTSQEKLKRRREVATQGRTSMIDAGGAKEGVRWRHGDKLIKKYLLCLIILYF
jgi:hypothetical protein